MSRILLSAIIAILSIVSYASGMEIEILELDVPPHVQRNRNLQMSCLYDIKGQTLESVSWFFNKSEIYRHTQYPNVDQEVYSVPALEVDVANSNATVLALKNLQLEASGDYKCSVSTDSPDYQMKEKTKHLEVVVIPKEGPVMEGVPKKGFKRGTTIPINCTSAPSKPASQLTFKSNGIIMDPKHIKNYPLVKTEDGLYITKAALLLKSKVNLFRNGLLNLKCFATIKTMVRASQLAVVKSSGEIVSQSLYLLVISLFASVRR